MADDDLPMTTSVHNKPYDAAQEVFDEEDVVSNYAPTPQPNENLQEKQLATDHELIQAVSGTVHLPTMYMPDDDDESDDDEELDEGSLESSDDAVDDNEYRSAQGYCAEAYEHLQVSSEIKSLFLEIKRFVPHDNELELILKPFIPAYIPAVGDTDPMVKIPRPDGKYDHLGMRILDEPTANQSDPSVLKLTIRMHNKQTGQGTEEIVKNIIHDHKAIEHWIESIGALNRTQPAPTVHYMRNMPSIDTLMQEWPVEFEQLLKETGLPSSDLDCNLTNYVDLICALLDIPVYKSRIQSLHLMFTLYSEFKNSQHFGRMKTSEHQCESAEEHVDHLKL